MDVAKQPGLMRRKARWYLRAKVPLDLVETIGRREIWQSLRTGDHAVAVKLYRRARADLDAWFEQQRRRRGAGERLNGEAPRLVAPWFAETERRAAELDFGFFGEVLHTAQGEAEQALADLLDDASGEEVEAAIDRVLTANGWPARPHTVGSISTRKAKVADAADEHRAAVRDLARRALVEMARRRCDRLHGRPVAGYDPAFNGAVYPVAQGGEGADAGRTLGELIKEFEIDKTQRLSPGKVTEYAALFRLLRQTWGEHKPIREIRPEDCRRIRDLVSVLPPHAEQRWPGKPLAEVAEHARTNGLAPMSAATANAHLQRLSTMMKWGVRQWWIDRNPAEGLSVTEPEGDPRDARYPFSTAQLSRIFGPDFAELLGVRRWIPLVALFSGARLNELCQLGVDDVVETDNVPVLMIRPDPEGARLKTSSARRIIPVHPELIKLGFLDHVERTKRAGHARLFPELRRDSRGRHSDLFQKWFSRFLEKIDAKEPKTSFHSFRHNFRDALREAEIPRDATLALGGWKAQTVDEQYGSGLRPSTLAREIAKIRYDLDLSRLYTAT